MLHSIRKTYRIVANMKRNLSFETKVLAMSRFIGHIPDSTQVQMLKPTTLNQQDDIHLLQASALSISAFCRSYRGLPEVSSTKRREVDLNQKVWHHRPSLQRISAPFSTIFPDSGRIGFLETFAFVIW